MTEFFARDAEVHDLHVAVGLHHDVLQPMSRWMMSSPCATESAWHTCEPISGDFALVDGAALDDGGFKVRPRTNSMTMYGALVLTPIVHVHDLGLWRLAAAASCLKRCVKFGSAAYWAA